MNPLHAAILITILILAAILILCLTSINTVMSQFREAVDKGDLTKAVELTQESSVGGFLRRS